MGTGTIIFKGGYAVEFDGDKNEVTITLNGTPQIKCNPFTLKMLTDAAMFFVEHKDIRE